MSKKSSKRKPTKSTGRGSSKDSVTGLYMDVDGARFHSDTTYDLLNSAEATALKNSLGADTFYFNSVFAEGGSARTEFEFGKNAIVWTIQVVGEISNNGNPQSSNDYTSRVAYLGDFEYNNKGALTKGNIREVAQWTRGTQWSDSTVIDRGSVDQGNASMGSRVWQLTAGNTDRVFNYDTYIQENGASTNSKEGFQSFAGSKYFIGAWWHDPFGPNLI